MSRHSQPSIQVEDSWGEGGEDPLLGQLFSGKYRVDERLADGGMAIVLRATHLELSCPVAIKLIRPEHAQNEEFVLRLLAEARVVASLHSKHANRVLDVGRTETGAPFLVLEYLSGSDLSDHLSRSGPFPVTAAVDCVLQACEALAEAHALGIVHRDLKPENLFLSEEADGSLILKVLDFGISRAPASHSGVRVISQVGTLVGTPAYMAPEQVQVSENLDARTDIWALGVVLYELLTRAQPFPGDSVPRTLALVMAGKPVPIEPAVGVPGGVVETIYRCLAKDPERRFQNVVELAKALAPFGSDAHSAERAARVAAMTLARIAPQQVESVEHHSSRRTPLTLVSVTPSSHAERVELERLERARRRRRLLATSVGALVVALPLGVGYFLLASKAPTPPPLAVVAMPALTRVAEAPAPPIVTTPSALATAALPLVVTPPPPPTPKTLAAVAPARARARTQPIVAAVIKAAPVNPEPAPIVRPAVVAPSVTSAPSAPPAPDAWDPKAFGGRR